MVKINISKIIVLEPEKCRRFLNNTPSGLVSCNVLARPHLPENIENHTLPYFTFTCVLQGTGRILLNRNINKLGPGTTFLRFSEEEFSIYRSEDYVEFSIALPSEFGTLLKKYYPNPFGILEMELTESLLTSFEYFFKIVRSTGNDKLLNSAVEMFLFITEIYSGEKTEKHLRENNFPEHACNLLKKSSDLTLPGVEAAKKLGMGYETFRKKFKQTMDISPKQYIMQLKFAKAAEMILNDYSIKETAFELGYSEISAFSRQFKRYYGISPAKYRQISKLEYL